MIRGYSFRDYQPGKPPRVVWEPVGFMDSDLLRDMMISAWDPEAQFAKMRETHRKWSREMFGEFVDGKRD